MMPWFKIKKQKNTFINGVDYGDKPQIEIIIEEEKEKQPKVIKCQTSNTQSEKK